MKLSYGKKIGFFKPKSMTGTLSRQAYKGEEKTKT